jgi:5-methylcytosine-specific restriction enzyme B
MLGMKAVKDSFDWVPGPLLQAIRGGQKAVVLEEANRTRLSQALGEIFSLVESRYRGEKYAVELRDGSKFFIPDDVVLYFTLNTLDTSTEEIDDALLGRVASVEFPPRVEDLRAMLASKQFPEARIDAISEFFAGVLDKYPLGHGYFAPVIPAMNLLRFYQAYIRPVLQKHFRHDTATLAGIDLLADEFFRPQ